jgi:dolichol-phosphate mannosyltransferase
MHDSYLSIVIPIYNESSILESSINRTLSVLEKAGYKYEIILVNDGSNDESKIIIDNHYCNHNQIKIVNHSKNLGFGAAIESGIKVAKGKYIWCVPVDSPLSEKVFKVFEKHFEKADILVSYRKKRIGYTWWMLLNSAVYHFIISKLFKINLKDFNWIHLYDSKIFKPGEIKIEYEGIFMLAEVLIKAKQKGYSIIEFEVEQEKRNTGIASASKIINILRTFRDVIKFYFYYKE